MTPRCAKCIYMFDDGFDYRCHHKACGRRTIEKARDVSGPCGPEGALFERLPTWGEWLRKVFTRKTR